MATQKGGQREAANEIAHLLKRQATGATKIGSEFQINTYTTGNQENPSVARLSAGQFVVTWQSSNQGNGDEIYGQLFNADGTKSGSEFLVNTYTNTEQHYPSIASLSNDKFVVTWQSWNQDGSYSGIYGQLFNTDGTKNGSEFQINTYTTFDQISPSVASLSDGKFIVTWQSDGQDGNNYGVYGQILNADGTKSGLEFWVNSYTIGRQLRPSVASLSNNKFIITWHSENQDGSGWGVYGQIFNGDGTKSGLEFLVNANTRDNQAEPSVVSLSNNKFIITWHSENQDGSGYGIFGQIFNVDGTKSGSEFQINTYTASSQNVPSVVSLNDNKFVVTWQSDGQDGNNYGVYGQIFNVDGAKSGSEFQINTYTTGRQQNPSIASLNDNKFVVTWQSDGQDGNNYGVYGQIFEAIIPTSSTTSSSTSSTTLSSTSSTTSSSISSSSSSSTRTSSSTSSSSLTSANAATGPRSSSLLWGILSGGGALCLYLVGGIIYILRRRKKYSHDETGRNKSDSSQVSDTFELGKQENMSSSASRGDTSEYRFTPDVVVPLGYRTPDEVKQGGDTSEYGFTPDVVVPLGYRTPDEVKQV